MDPITIVDTLALAGGQAAASHSCLVSPELVPAPAALLVAVAEAYKRLIARLPPFDVASRPGGGHCLGPALLARRLPLLSFAAPYLALARGGRELRYPIVGGLAVRAPGGYLAFGLGAEGAQARLWVDVVGLQPLLGLGPFYILTQAQIHRLLTIAFLRRLASALASGGTLPLPQCGA